jgi:hypothetical protein
MILQKNLYEVKDFSSDIEPNYEISKVERKRVDESTFQLDSCQIYSSIVPFGF